MQKWMEMQSWSLKGLAAVQKKKKKVVLIFYFSKKICSCDCLDLLSFYVVLLKKSCCHDKDNGNGQCARGRALSTARRLEGWNNSGSCGTSGVGSRWNRDRWEAAGHGLSDWWCWRW